MIAGLLCPVPGVAATPHSTLQSEIDARIADNPGTGIIAATIDAGGVHFYQAGSSGTARPLDKHTLFEIGSVTKTFTAAILAQIILAHRVSLSDPVATYLPSSVHVPSRDGKQITLGNLATQHSGLPRMPTNFKPANPNDPYLDYSARDLYAFLNSYKLPRDPGAKFEYSNVGVGLLGLALQHAARMDYTALVRAYVWKPLGMNESRIALGSNAKARFAVGHNDADQPVHSWEFTDAIAGAGSIRSDAADMVKYLRAAMGQGPLGRAMLFAEKPRVSLAPGYKIGLIWWTDEKHRLIQHGGDTAGYHAMVAMTADHSRGIVMLSNGPGVDDIALHWLNASYPIATLKTAKLSDDQLDQYVGVYDNLQAGIRYTIARKGHDMIATIAGQPAARIYPSRLDHFFYTVVSAYIEFVRRQGKVVGLVLTQAGQHVGVPKLGPDGKPLVPSVVPQYPPVVKLPAGTLSQYEGTFERAGVPYVITVSDGHVFARLSSQPHYEIYPSAKDHFYYKIVDALLTFNRDSAGNVISLSLDQNGRRTTFVKKP